MAQTLSPSRQITFISAVAIVQLVLLIGGYGLVTARPSQERRFPQSEIALEVVLPNSSQSPLRFQIPTGGRSGTLINRQQLIIMIRNLQVTSPL